ncbi:hypothetical protein PENTCL1PPCAC_21535 [Pristionchus entomophagus]|uniref:Peptidase n=1 Tax=Pristionchus entomophagus TaxID=358040 RepID=A0AAV5TYM7_9BILA|nr:hypothetical protein PENTCL1PPCAC_21535 [Pristionchus entomophagus]
MFQPLPVRQMKWFYDSCMTGASQKQFLDRSVRIFNDLRTANPSFGFPALFPTETKAATADQLAYFLGYTLASIGRNTLIDAGVDTDWKDPHNSNGGYALLVDQPQTFFIDTFYTKIWDDDYVAEYFLGILNQSAQLLGIKNLDQKQAFKDAQDLAQFDYDLATKYSTDDTTRRQYARSYNPYNVDGLQKLAPFINWKTYFDNALAPISKTVDGSFRAIAMEVDMLALLSADIASGTIPSRTVNNYLYMITLDSNYLPPLPILQSASSRLKGFRRTKSSINRKIRHDPKRRDPMDMAVVMDFTANESRCLGLTNAFMMWANTRIFVDTKYPTAKDKQAVRDHTNSIIRSILVAFRAQIDILDWMSPASKKGAYQKIDNLVVNIAFPDWVLNDGKKDAYLDMVDKLIAFSIYESFLPLVNGVPADRTDFSGPAAITNAWYQPEVNSITFPGGILNAPFYDVSYPAAINYGGLGVIGGHELTHGFDDEGVQWEGTGILNGWMDDNSTSSFTKMAHCVVNEYNQFCPLGKGLPCIDGDQTQGENIADNGGIQAAYKAFKAYEALNGPDPLLPGDASQFNPDQLFFIGFAQVWCEYPPSAVDTLFQILTDPHSPSLYRVLGTIQNIPAFQKAFNCPSGSTYAPLDHCDVWTSEPTSGAPLNDKGEPVEPDNEVNIEPVERISPQDMDKYAAYQNGLNTLKVSANLSVPPCDDFYHYSCQNFPGAQTTISDGNQAIYQQINDKLSDPDYQTNIVKSDALTKLNNLFEACKSERKKSTINDVDYLQPKVLKFRNYINQNIPLIGGTGNIDVTPENYGNVLGYLSFNLGIDTLVSPGVDTNWKNPQGTNGATSGYMLFVDEPSPYKTHAFYDDENWKQQKKGYKDTVTKLVEAYAKQDTTAKLPVNYVDMIDDALELEKTIATTYSRNDDERRAFARQWNPMKIADLPTTVDFNKLWSFSPKEGQDWIAANKDIVLNEPEKTPHLFNFLALQPDDTKVVNYLFIRLLLANSGLIPCSNGKCAAVMRELAIKHVSDHTGIERLPRRGRGYQLPSFAPQSESDPDGVSCANSIGALPEAQGRVYIDARFPTDADRKMVKDKTMGVMTNIVDAMKGMIDQLDWMDSDSKKGAIQKAENIVVNVAYPEWILDKDQLDAYFADLKFDKDDKYYNMLDKITLYSIGQDFKKLNLAVADRTGFSGGQIAVVNAFYSDDKNAITFPAGILQSPFFDVNFPAGMNYGGLGVVAGHELTHGFDDKGVQWDYQGALNSWMDAPSQDGFDKMAKCVVDEYNKFCPLPDDKSPHCTNGVQTQGENIADNGGIHSAWRAYENHIELDGPDPLFMDRVYSQYTNNQLYFLNFAQVWCMQKTMMTESYISGKLMTDSHSLGPYRVLGTLQNIPAFRANFNCPLGSTYAPVDHCNVWVPTKMA